MAIDCPGHDSKAFPTKGKGDGRGLLAEADARIEAEDNFNADQARQTLAAQQWLDAQTCAATGCKPGHECVVGKVKIDVGATSIKAIMTFSPKGSGFDTATCEFSGAVTASAFCDCVTHAEAKALREAKKKRQEDKKKSKIRIE